MRLVCLAPRTLWNVFFLNSQYQTMQHVNTTVNWRLASTQSHLLRSVHWDCAQVDDSVSCTVPLKDGICERAFPPNSSCVVQCKLETCREYCRHVMDEFPDTTGLCVLTCKSHTSHAITPATWTVGPVNSGSVNFAMDFTSNITLKRQGVLEFQPTLSGATPADGSVFGLLWKVSHQNGFVAYIPQVHAHTQHACFVKEMHVLIIHQIL